MASITSKLQSLPAAPGVYLFKNAGGEILYVGKAKVLKNRVRSYFTQSHDLTPRTAQLVANIADFEYIITDNEVEALMLENNFIKKNQPRYNVLLRDDKNYQFIKIDYSTQIPLVYTVRKIEDLARVRPLPNPPLARGGEKRGEIPQVYTTRKIEARTRPPRHLAPLPNPPHKGEGKSISYKLQANRYFGPYTSSAAVRQTLSLLRNVIPYCANKKVSNRPCFYYHLGRCPGVCAGIITLTEYQKTLRALERFLTGDLNTLRRDLKKQMLEAARARKFEKAARLRDQVAALAKMLERQKIISPRRESHDAVGLFAVGQMAAVTLFQIRAGRLIGRENFILQNVKDETPTELLRAFLQLYYSEASDVPMEIDLPVKVSELSGLELLLQNKFGKKISFAQPMRGRKRKLIKLAETNAQDFLQTTSQNLAKEQAQLTHALFELKDRLRLPAIPLRIECYDISNIQGASAVGSMVVFANGKPKKSDYKRFAIKTVDTPNDVGMMKEMLVRRLKHASTSPDLRPPSPIRPRAHGREAGLGRAGGEIEPWKLPDLIIVDGGRAQLNVALEVLKDRALKIPALGLAKRLEEIYLPQLKSPLRLPDKSPALHLLQRIRDEAHRFAVAYHRKKRSKKLLEI